MDKPKSKHGERFVKVKAKLFTWTVVEDVIEYDTLYEQFILYLMVIKLIQKLSIGNIIN